MVQRSWPIGTNRSLRRTLLRIATVAAFVVTALGFYASTFVVSYSGLFPREDSLVVADVSRLSPTRVRRIDRIREEQQLQDIIHDARQRGLKVSIAGSRHSQGGHTYTENGVVLDMRSFNRIREVDPAAMTITVESGATWVRSSERSRRRSWH